MKEKITLYDWDGAAEFPRKAVEQSHAACVHLIPAEEHIVTDGFRYSTTGWKCDKRDLYVKPDDLHCSFFEDKYITFKTDNAEVLNA